MSRELVSRELQTWAPRLEAAIGAGGLTSIDRVAVLASTASTQDAAREMAVGRPGLMVVAGEQTAGRGRLGRAWSDAAGLGVAATFVLDALRGGEPGLPIAAGVAACRTVEAALGRGGRLTAAGGAAVGAARGVVEAVGILSLNPLVWAVAGLGRIGRSRIGLRWPNDVVEVPPGWCWWRRERKIAGVLIEVKDGLTLIGVGINVLQFDDSYPVDLCGRAVSVGALGSTWSRIDVAERLLIELDAALSDTPERLAHQWQRRDILVGSRRTFDSGGRRITGKVEAIQPTGDIQIKADDGQVVKLGALTTSLVHDP